jgi:hypothetical protein
MKRSLPLFLLGAVVVLAAVFGNARLWLQRLELCTSVELARLDVAELARLRARNQHLREKQLPPAELAALRADHEALLRLRAELEALTRSATGGR